MKRPRESPAQCNRRERAVPPAHRNPANVLEQYRPARVSVQSRPLKMGKKERNDFLDRLVYLALRVVNMAVHSWGIGVASALAKFVGATMYALDRKHRDRALGNLRRSFP